VAKSIHEHGMRAAVAINPGTPASAITDEVAAVADMILVMTVWPGHGGQKFIEDCLPKVRCYVAFTFIHLPSILTRYPACQVAELRNRFPSMNIQVDGGVGAKTIHSCAHAGQSHLGHTLLVRRLGVANYQSVRGILGANVAVAGSALFGAENPAELIVTMRSAINEARPQWKQE
jgi:ribulose-phosphate 3-epimerase